MTEHTLHQESILSDSLEREIMRARLDDNQTMPFAQLLRRTLKRMGRGLAHTFRFIGELTEDLARARAASERFSRSWW